MRQEILPEFFRNFWVRRMALDRRNYKQVVETTVELANKVGAAEIVARVCDDLKDESEPYRRMVMETIEHVVQDLGAADIDERLEESRRTQARRDLFASERLHLSVSRALLASSMMGLLGCCSRGAVRVDGTWLRRSAGFRGGGGGGGSGEGGGDERMELQ